MTLENMLKKRGLSVLRCSQISGIPYTTLLELVRKKTDLKKCTAETVYKLAKALNTSVEELLEQHDQEQLVTFETFKSSMCHRVKVLGDVEFIIEVLEEKTIDHYWEKKRYLETYYTLAMLDYLSRQNDLPICSNYNHIRRTSLKQTIFPRDIELASKISPELDVKKQAIADSIPEFIRFNIVERGIRDVC